MGTVTVGPIIGSLAVAQRHLLFFGDGKFDRQKIGSFM
jgi:hypothetical protein